MIRFECDYAEGAHPKVLEALVKTNFEQSPVTEQIPIAHMLRNSFVKPVKILWLMFTLSQAEHLPM